jgi:uncharacterized iron-regulated protein
MHTGIRISWPATLALLFSTALPAADDLLRLPIGDPARRDREAPVVLDAITDTSNGELISTTRLLEQLSDVGILFIGEDHTNVEFHRVQANVIRSLHESGRQVLIALEMFPYTAQKALDRWTRGQYATDAEFINSADWYTNWGYNWGYYAEIFHLARDNRLRMFGINAPRDVIKAVRTEGFEKLSAEDAEHIPTSVATDDPDHRRLYLAYFDDGDSLHTQLPAEQLDGMVRAQATWDAVMGWNALQALRRHGGPNAIVVVLIGAGHAVYDVGSQRQLADRFDGKMASLLPVPVKDHGGKQIMTVQASYANFLWGVPPAAAPIYPSLGLSLAGSLGRAPNNIIQVENGTPAAAAGLRVGDQLLTLAGQAITGPATLRQAMGELRWGDETEVEVRREEATVQASVLLRRPSQKD